MSVPFDTLKLARQFEAAGFVSKQAGDMAAAIAEATTPASLESRLEAKIDRIVIRLGALIVVVAGLASTIAHFWR